VCGRRKTSIAFCETAFIRRNSSVSSQYAQSSKSCCVSLLPLFLRAKIHSKELQARLGSDCTARAAEGSWQDRHGDYATTDARSIIVQYVSILCADEMKGSRRRKKKLIPCSHPF